MRLSKWLVRLEMLASALWSAVFIARTAFTVNGQRYFTLFDDAMISMRYARNLAEGRGLIWDEGQPPLEGFTNFLWTVWMAVLHWVPLPDRLTPLLVSISSAALLVLGVWLSAQVARQLLPTSAAAPVLAAGLTASSYPLVYWALRGMEVGLISVLATASVLLVLRLRDAVTSRRLCLLGAFLALAVLTRLDALIIAMVLVPATFLLVTKTDRRRLLLPLVALPIGTLVAQTVFRLAYYGEIVPNTYVLKVREILLEDRIERGVKVVLHLGFKGAMLLLGVAAVGALIAIWRQGDRSVAAPAALVAAFVAYTVYVGGDAWEQLGFANRYVSVVLPVLFALVAVGLASLRGRTRLVAGMLAVGVIVVTAGAQYTVPPTDGFASSWQDVSRWFVYGTVVIAVTALLVLLLSMRTGKGSVRFIGAIAPAIVAVALALTVNAPAIEGWARSGAEWSERDNDSARYGVALKEFTRPQTRIALSTAGNLGYFAGPDRYFIDELGKMDPVIAAMKPNRPDLPPGHQKWDYRYSFDVLQPDLISEVFAITEDEANYLQDRGWIRVNDDTFVRRDATGVDIEGLRRYHQERKQQAGAK